MCFFFFFYSFACIYIGISILSALFKARDGASDMGNAVRARNAFFFREKVREEKLGRDCFPLE